ncbi:F/Y-rich N-terminus-domain-containing protein [Balamuthia mandrillaris]
MWARLTGEGVDVEAPPNGEGLVLGRKKDPSSSSAFIRIPNDKTVSRKHAQLKYNEANHRWQVKVFGKNGLYVNDVLHYPVDEEAEEEEEGAQATSGKAWIPLADGSLLQVGDLVLTFRLAADQQHHNGINDNKAKGKKKKGSSEEEVGQLAKPRVGMRTRSATKATSGGSRKAKEEEKKKKSKGKSSAATGTGERNGAHSGRRRKKAKEVEDEDGNEAELAVIEEDDEDNGVDEGAKMEEEDEEEEGQQLIIDESYEDEASNQAFPSNGGGEMNLNSNGGLKRKRDHEEKEWERRRQEEETEKKKQKEKNKKKKGKKKKDLFDDLPTPEGWNKEDSPPSKRKRHTHGIKQYVPVKRDKEGNIKFPIVIGGLKVYSLGSIVWDRKKFHAKRYIWPVGYKSTRVYPCMDDPSLKCVYTSEILDGKDGPLFRVSPSVGGRVITASTASGAWTEIVKTVNGLKLEKTGKRLFTTVSGPEMFGYSHPTIAKLIQDLPGAEKCRRYIFQEYVEKQGALVGGGDDEEDNEEAENERAGEEEADEDELQEDDLEQQQIDTGGGAGAAGMLEVEEEEEVEGGSIPILATALHHNNT